MHRKYLYKNGMTKISHLLSVRKGTILALLASGLAVVIMLIWLFLSSLGWFVNQLPGVFGNGQQAVDSMFRNGLHVLDSSGMVTPEIRSHLDQLSVLVSGERPVVEQAIGGVVTEGISGVKRYLEDSLPVRDVSGIDISPVERYPGFVRTSFATENGKRTVVYSGRADFELVVAHYVAGFERKGYRHDVISASPTRELHRFISDEKSETASNLITEMTFIASKDGVLEVVVTAID